MRHSQILSPLTILLIASFFTGFERAHSQNVPALLEPKSLTIPFTVSSCSNGGILL